MRQSLSFDAFPQHTRLGCELCDGFQVRMSLSADARWDVLLGDLASSERNHGTSFAIGAEVDPQLYALPSDLSAHSHT